MTREEMLDGLYEIKNWKCNGDDKMHEVVTEAIKAVEQEPFEDEYIKVPKRALKYRTAGMVAYNAEWLKDHFDIERAVICGAQEPCDAISRQAVLESIKNLYPDMPVVDIMGARRKWLDKYAPYFECENAVEHLSPVNPQPKTGHWIMDGSVDCYLDKVRCHCSECGKKKIFPADYDHIKKELSISYKYPGFIDNYCPNCGAKMVEKQESGVEDGNDE